MLTNEERQRIYEEETERMRVHHHWVTTAPPSGGWAGLALISGLFWGLFAFLAWGAIATNEAGGASNPILWAVAVVLTIVTIRMFRHVRAYFRGHY